MQPGIRILRSDFGSRGPWYTLSQRAGVFETAIRFYASWVIEDVAAL